MAYCAACGAKLEEGISRCPDCGAILTRPGTLLQMGGWVIFFASWIPLVVGVISAQQGNFIVLGAGIAAWLLGVVFIIVGRLQGKGAPPTTRPAPAPGATSGGGPQR